MDSQIVQQNSLTILHFNDVYDIEPDSNGMCGFVNFYHSFLELKKQYPSSIIAFSGDAFAPSKLSRVRKGWQMVHCLKMLKIDVACYGNHDFDYLPQHSLQLAKQSQVPWLLANVKYQNSGMNLGEGLDYYIIERPGFKVGFMGLAGPDFKGRLISAYKDKLDYENPIQVAKKLCKILKEKGCNLIVALTHMRIPADENLAKNVPQIDLILGGHDHVVLSKIVNKIPLLKSGTNFQHIGVYKIFSQDCKQEQKISHKGRNWLFKFNCPSISKTRTRYPQLQKYISQVVKQYKQRGIAKPKQTIVGFKKDKTKQKLNQWKFKYGTLNGKVTLQISSNLLSELCFAKSVCFHKKMYFSHGSVQLFQQADPIQTIIDSLKFIQKQISTIQKKESAIIFGPGFASLPYIIECFNTIYLPSQLLVKFDSIDRIYQIIKYCNIRGIQCIGIIQLLTQKEKQIKGSNNKWYAKIAFLNIPMIYQNIIKSRNTQNLVFFQLNQYKNLRNLHAKQSVFIEYPPFQGQRQYVSYLKSKKNQSNNKPQKHIQNDDNTFLKDYMIEVKNYTEILNKNICKLQICLNRIKQQLLLANNIIYQQKQQQPTQNNSNKGQLKKQIQNIAQSIVQKKPALKDEQFQTQIHQQKIKQKQENQIFKPTIIRILTQNPSKLEIINAKIVYQISKQYINFNRQQNQDDTYKGIVFNQDQLCNPTYELGYGYIPILFKTESNENSQVLSIIQKEQLNMKQWFNLKLDNFDGYLSQKDWKHPVYELLRKQNKNKNDMILQNSKNRPKTLQWVTKYAKKSYQKVKFLPINFFFKIFSLLSKQFEIQIQ